MSHIAEVVTYKARRLKAQASYSGVVASLFTGGVASTIVWSANGLAPWATAMGITLSLAGAATFGVKAPLAYRRYAMIRELSALQQTVAVALNQFPDKTDHELRMASLKTRDTWARLENRLAGGDELSEEHIMKFYEVLERVNGNALIRFSEASSAIEKVSSWEEVGRIRRELQDIEELTERIEDRYKHLILMYSDGKRLDFSLEGARRAAFRLTTSPSEQAMYTKRVIKTLRDDDKLTADQYQRMFETISQLEPLVKGVLVSPSRRKQAILNFELIDLEIDVFTPDWVLRKLKLERYIE